MSEPDYTSLLRRAKTLRPVILLANPRSGTDFIHSLIDGHPEVRQQPGAYDWAGFWNSSLARHIPDSANHLIQEFIYWNNHAFQNQLSKFDSRFNTYENWHHLGRKRDEHFTVDQRNFARHLAAMLDEVRGRPLELRTFIDAVHVAYALTAGQDVQKHSSLLLHVHRPGRLKALLDIVPEYLEATIVISFRSPFFVLDSEYHAQMQKFPTFNLAKRHAWKYCRTWMSLDDLGTFRTRIVSLHELHAAPGATTHALAEALEVSWAPELIESTQMGIEWWGDSQSDVRDPSGLRGFNAERHTLDQRCPAGLTERLVMECLYQRRLTMMNVPILRVANWPLTRALLLVLLPILALLPTRLELTLFRYELRRAETIREASIAIAVSTVSWLYRYGRVLSAWARPASRYSVQHRPVVGNTALSTYGAGPESKVRQI